MYQRTHVVVLTVLVIAATSLPLARANLVLQVLPDNSITVDGNPNDWALGSTNVYGGVDADPGTPDIMGDVAYQGWEGANYYEASHDDNKRLGKPVNQADHTARVYSRYDDTYLYFLAVVSDDDVNTPNASDTVWANDCIEIYLDPGHAASPVRMDDSTSELQLVIDASGQKNVYMTTPGYAAQVLAGVTSAGALTANGYVIEASIQWSVLDPDLPNTHNSRFGLDLAFRDNDGDGRPAGTAKLSSMTSWSDTTDPRNYPSKIPGNWGDGFIAPEPVTLAMLTLGGLLCLRRRRA